MNVDAIAFTEQWLAACNSHDVESVLKHFHQDVVFTSPLAAELFPETAGLVRGKAELRRWKGPPVVQLPAPPEEEPQGVPVPA